MALAEIFEVIIAEAHNVTALPSYATPNFVAGRIQVLYDVDLHAELQACMTPDSAADTGIEMAMKQLEAGDKDYFYNQMIYINGLLETDY